jgi:pilus assembly protein CpaB
MERRNLIIIGAAVLFGLLAVYLANSWFSGVERQQERQVASGEQGLTRVAVASRAMEFGTPLTADNVRLAAWPADSVPPGSVGEADMQRILSGGNVTIRPIASGEPILLSRISERAVLSANIPADLRAVTVPVDAVSGVAGFVTPGDAVDVLLTRQIAGDGAGRDDKLTTVVLESVPVLAMDTRASESNTDPAESKTATLLVNPEGAQKLTLATQIGRLSLALRNVEDQGTSARRLVTSRELGGGVYMPARRTGGSAAPAAGTQIAAVSPVLPGQAALRRPTGPTMTVVRGTEATIEEVQRYGF